MSAQKLPDDVIRKDAAEIGVRIAFKLPPMDTALKRRYGLAPAGDVSKLLECLTDQFPNAGVDLIGNMVEKAENLPPDHPFSQAMNKIFHK